MDNYQCKDLFHVDSQHFSIYYEFGNQNNIFFPPIEYCTDNAAMIALTGNVLLSNGNSSPFNLKPIPNLNLV